MSTFETRDMLREAVRRRPSPLRLFEEEGIDYCCGGKKSLEEVCREEELSPQELIIKVHRTFSRNMI